MRTSSIRALQSDTGLDRTAFQTVCVQPRQLGCRRDTARSLLQSAVPRRSCCRAPALVASIDISRLHAAQQQTRRMPLLRFNDGTDGRTDGLPTATETPLHTMRGIAGSIVHRQANIHH